MPHLGDLFQDGLEAAAATRLFIARTGPVGASKERLQLWGDKDVQGPATTTSGGLQKVHVHPVNVRTLFSVNLDGDKVGVNQPRDAWVVEGLVGHDVTPMAGAVADGDEQQLVGAARQLYRLWRP